MPRLRFALLTIFVLLGGSAMFWWLGSGQPDPVYALMSQLPQPAADLVSVAVRKSGYPLRDPQTTATSVASRSVPTSDTPGPELMAAVGEVDTEARGPDRQQGVPAGADGRVAIAESATSEGRLSTHGLSLKLEPAVAFRSLPRISSALFSESRRLVVYFPLDEFELMSPAQEALRNLAASLGEARQLFTLRIDGHCDDTGDYAYNQSLSERRARAVKDFLLEQGLTAESTVLRGFGERIPVVVAEDRGSRARNRRAEIWVEWVESRKAEAPQRLLNSGD